MFQSKKVMMTLMFVLLQLSCDASDNLSGPGKLQEKTRDFVVWGDYTNVNRISPQFIVKADSSDLDNVSIGAIKTTVSNGEVTIVLKNVSLFDTTGSYVIDSTSSVFVEEKREGRIWVNDSEFSHELQALTSIGVVLVLDESSSIGADFSDLKLFTKEFVQIINNNIPNTQIGVVAFSRQISSFPLTSNTEAVLQFIEGRALGENGTKLYDAMVTGIGFLKDLNLDGTALVTFTDGTDNLSSSSSAEVARLLTNSDIKSYTIGLQGNLDEQLLADLAVRGESQSAPTVTGLQRIFQKFSREITNIYNLNYIRNDQQIVDAMPIRFTFTGKINIEP